MSENHDLIKRLAQALADAAQWPENYYGLLRESMKVTGVEFIVIRHGSGLRHVLTSTKKYVVELGEGTMAACHDGDTVCSDWEDEPCEHILAAERHE
jgi:hypothetical protein